MNMHVAAPKMSVQEKRVHVAMFILFMSIVGFLAYMWWSKPPQAVVSKQSLTPIQEVSVVNRQITACLTDPNVPEGEALKPIWSVSPRTEKGGYFIPSFDGNSYFNTSGAYLKRLLHCQSVAH